ncbi:MAG: hypothetical protein NTY32_13510 [Bacteroidia bacterium]|nr:hypothetical protein [Bacteroidia bacterium]
MDTKKNKLLLCILLMTALSLPVYGQKTIKMDPDLKGNSSPMEAKRKAITTFPKYHFGPYSVVSAKAGWTTTKGFSKFRFIIEDTNLESKTKSSFVLVGNGKDTVKVNSVNNVLTSASRLGNFTSTNQVNSNYVANILVTADSSEWQLKLFTEMGEQVAGSFTVDGVLTNGETNIQIRSVKEWDTGKTDLFKLILGYELVLDNQSLAAIQAPQMTTKRFVWIRASLDEHLKLVLATASAALMVDGCRHALIKVSQNLGRGNPGFDKRCRTGVSTSEWQFLVTFFRKMMVNTVFFK